MPSNKATNLPNGFVSYVPGSQRKLNVFEDKECLLDVLGSNDEEPIQEWKPEDRIIDVTGREYRLVKQPGKKGYDIDPTGETWSYEKLLSLAEADARLLKRNPEDMRRQLDSVPEDKRMAALMKSIDNLPVGVWWFMPAFFLFLLLFFLAVVFIAGKFFMWLSTRYQWRF